MILRFDNRTIPLLTKTKWFSVDLHPTLRAGLTKLRFEFMTEIQEKSFVPISQRKDTILSAECASGKTAAFLVPLANRNLIRRDHKLMSPPVVVLSPTPALSEQSFEFCQKLSPELRAQMLETNTPKRIDWANTDFVFGTPLQYLLDQPQFEKFTPSCLVMDEADQLLEGTFRSETAEIIDGVRGVQCVYSGATMHSSSLSRIFKRHPTIEYLTSDNFHKIQGDVDFKWITAGDGDLESKLIALASTVLPKTTNKVLIFCNTKEQTKKVYEFLEKTGWIKGDGSISILTDGGARGLVYPGVSEIINFDFPSDAYSFIHRSGRLGERGTVFSILSREEASKELVKRLNSKMKDGNRLHSVFSVRRSLRNETRKQKDVST